GDILSDATYERNRAVEDAYGIKITKLEDNDSPQTLASTNVQAGDDFADIPLIRIRNFFPTAQQGIYLDWSDYEDVIMLDAEWWDQRVYEQLAIGDKIYALQGDFTNHDEFCMLSVYYNKKVYEDNGFEDAYTLVKDGKWTFDVMWEQVSAVSADLNGDGKMDKNDLFGLLTEHNAFNYFYTAAGYMPIINNNGKLTFNLGDEKSFNIVEKVSVIATEKNKNSLISDDGNFPDTYAGARALLMADQGLFYTGMMSAITNFRESDRDIGMLPMPKYDETQDSYYNQVSWNVVNPVMPITVSDPERTALILDAMGYYSMMLVNEPFFNVFLDEKAARDEESKDMLDIIFNTKTYDLDWYAGISGFSGILSNIAKSGQNNFASEYAKIEASAKIKLDEFIKGFAD
nr:hypothetical protein [Clostridia bacterium]